jgi:hypothetical protein
MDVANGWVEPNKVLVDTKPLPALPKGRKRLNETWLPVVRSILLLRIIRANGLTPYQLNGVNIVTRKNSFRP